MAAVPITVPGVGESITEGILCAGSSPTDRSSRLESRSSSSRPTRPTTSFRPVRRASSRSPSRRARPWPSVPRSARLTPPTPFRGPDRLRLRHPPPPRRGLRVQLQRPHHRPRARLRPPLHPTAAPPRRPECHWRRPSAAWWPRTRSIPRASLPRAGQAGSPREMCWPTFKHQRQPAKKSRRLPPHQPWPLLAMPFRLVAWPSRPRAVITRRIPLPRPPVARRASE